jgi:hypothetical protein
MTGDGHDLSFDGFINEAGKSSLGVSEVDGQHVESPYVAICDYI